jgi:acyl transferase domain-containing protein
MSGSVPDVWMFSGQGSQYHGMGVELFEADAAYRAAFERCDALARPLLGSSLVHELYERKLPVSEPMVCLRHSHPALFCVQYATAQVLFARGLRPDRLLGYSLGELVAWTVAGALTLESALRFVIAQAQALESRGPHGAMLAVLDEPERMIRERALFAGVWLSAENFARHFVVSGTLAAIEGVEARLASLGVTVARLPVPHPFHSPLMDVAEPMFQAPPVCARGERGVQVISACHASSIECRDGRHFWEVAREPVRFRDTIAHLERVGPARYIDLGPSGTLATFVKYNLQPGSRSAVFPIVSPWRDAERNLTRLAG